MANVRCLPCTPHGSLRRVWLVAAGGLLGLVLLMLAPASPAAAHATLVESDPAADQVVDAAPDEIVLTFSEQVQPVDGRVIVVGPDGDTAHAGAPTVEGEDVRVPVGAAEETGTYLVSYRVISQDNHPVGGSVAFSVGAPSETPEVPEEVGDPNDPVVGALVSLNKYLGYAGLVLAVGPALMLGRLWPARLSRTALSRVAWTGLGLVGVSAVAAVVLQAPYGAGKTLGEIAGADVQEVLSSTFGAAHVVRLGVLVSVALLLRPLLAGRATRVDGLLLAGLAVVGVGTWPFSGHPVASPIPAVTMAAGVLHVAAAAVWIGGLLVLAGWLLRRADARELSAILPEWSRWATMAVAGLVLAGLVLATVETRTFDALVSTAYGQLLLVKAGLLAVVVFVAGFSRRLVRRRLAPRRPGTLRWFVTVEAVVLAGVLVVSSVLVQQNPARVDDSAPGDVATTDFVTSLESPQFSLELWVEPALRGSNTVHLYSNTPDGEPLPVEEWEATAALPAENIEPLEISLLPLTDNHAFGDVALPVEGEWEFEITLRLSEFEQDTVTTTVPVADD